MSPAVGTGSPPVVLFLIHDLRVGGAERALVSYLNHLRRVRPILVVLRARGDLIRELDPAIPVHGLDDSTSVETDARHRFGDGVDRADAHASTQGWSDDLLSLARKATRLRVIVRRAGVTVISTFLHKSHVLGFACSVGLEERVALVANVHELVSRHLEHHHGTRDRLFLRQFSRHGLPRFDRVCVAAESVRQDLVRQFGVPEASSEVHHPPLDLDRIRRGGAEASPVDLPPGEGPLVVAVGRLVRLKGFDVLLRAFAILRAEQRVRLVIVGDGEERAALTRLIDELQLRQSAALVGQQANPWRYMAAADVVALSSRTEAFPTVLGEAMALGRTVVAAECSPGVREYLEDGRCGLLVPPENPDALAAALGRALRDAAMRDRLALAAARRASSLALPTAARRYEDLLMDVAGSVSPRGVRN